MKDNSGQGKDVVVNVVIVVDMVAVLLLVHLVGVKKVDCVEEVLLDLNLEELILQLER